MGYWVRRGGDVHVRDPFAGRNWTALLHAAFLGHEDMVRHLVCDFEARLDDVEPFEVRRP